MNSTWAGLFSNAPEGKARSGSRSDMKGQPIPGYEASNCEP